MFKSVHYLVEYNAMCLCVTDGLKRV